MYPALTGTVMKTTSTLFRKASTGSKVKRLRIASLLTQQELADLAGVTREQVDLFERNLPLPLDARRRILRELWAKKFKK
jgi:transcriptional regulator with XRE-family HTH domain